MRKIIRDALILASLMILTVFSFSIAGVGLTEEIRLVFLLFGLAFILSAVNYAIDEMTSLPMLISYLVKYLIVSVIVIAFGFVAGWFYPSNFWMAFIYVGVIAAVVFALDSVKTEKDIEDINEMVKISKNEKVEFITLRKRKGFKILLILLGIMALLSAVTAACFLRSGKTEYSEFFLEGFAVSFPALIILLILLIIYLALYNIHRKRTEEKI